MIRRIIDSQIFAMIKNKKCKKYALVFKNGKYIFFSRICARTSTVTRYTAHYAVPEVTTVDAKSHLRTWTSSRVKHRPMHCSRISPSSTTHVGRVVAPTERELSDLGSVICRRCVSFSLSLSFPLARQSYPAIIYTPREENWVNQPRTPLIDAETRLSVPHHHARCHSTMQSSSSS